MVFTTVTAPPAEARANSAKFYRAAWRWHFYAGLYVIPFLIMLAVTGLIMLWVAVLSGRDSDRIAVVPQGDPLAISAQAEAALAAFPDGRLVQYIVPRSADVAAVFRVDVGDAAHMVAVDPYLGTVITSEGWRAGLYDLASDIHGTLLIGTPGDRLIEIAASLSVLLVVTGLYLWWPRNGARLGEMLIPDFAARGRSLWKSLHRVTGFWMSALLLVFLVSGLSWAGIWGERYVQAWSTFPAEKWDNVPLSDETHAAMNHGAAKEVPWGLEQTPMPMSGSGAGVEGLPEGAPVDVDALVGLARDIGFAGRFQLRFPADEAGVWTISHDSMSNDGPAPTADRTVHVDQYTGRILAEVGFADYSVYAKGMAVGIALHEGDMGWWNVALNTLFCLSMIFLAVSGVVMWWLRRPTAAGRLVAPPMPADMPLWKGAVVLGLLVAIAFPLAGITLLVVLALDLLVLSNVPALKRLVS